MIIQFILIFLKHPTSLRNGARHLNQVALNLPVSGCLLSTLCRAPPALLNTAPYSFPILPLLLFFFFTSYSKLFGLVCRLSRLLCRRVALHQKPLVGPACTRACSCTRAGLACEDVRMRRRAAVRAPRTRYRQTTYALKSFGFFRPDLHAIPFGSHLAD